MWQTVSDFILTWLDPIGIVVGLVVTLPVFWTWWEVVFGQRRRQRRWFEEIRRHPGERPAILILDLLPKASIRPQVEKYRRRHLTAVPEERVFVLRRDRPLSTDALPALHDELDRIVAEVFASGADRVHCFHAGPAVIAALVGARFANAMPLLLYHHENGAYHPFGPLRMKTP